MVVILTAFSLFHLVAGLASLGMALRLLTPSERALWRSPPALLTAELLVWIYPILAFVGAKVGWRAFNAGEHSALPLMLSPLLWLLVMGLIFAIVDFAEDGILGNARVRSP
jgi:hypothetical protein